MFKKLDVYIKHDQYVDPWRRPGYDAPGSGGGRGSKLDAQLASYDGTDPSILEVRDCRLNGEPVDQRKQGKVAELLNLAERRDRALVTLLEANHTGSISAREAELLQRIEAGHELSYQELAEVEKAGYETQRAA